MFAVQAIAVFSSGASGKSANQRGLNSRNVFRKKLCIMLTLTTFPAV